MVQDRMSPSPLYQDDMAFAKEEQKRRKAQPVVIKAADVAEKQKTMNNVHIVDPRLGFNNRTHRFWINRLAAGSEEGNQWKYLGHRHTVEAVIYWVTGHGHSIIDGVRHDWKAGDLVCVPMFAWHRHINETDEPIIYTASTTGPLSRSLGLAVYEDERYPEYWVFAQEGEESQKTLVPGGKKDLPDFTADTEMARLYMDRVNFAANEEVQRRASKVLVKGDDITLESTPMGRLAYVVDNRLGFYTKALATAIAELTPGKHSGAHRHLYDEIDYILEGEGQVIVDDHTYDIAKGDTVSVPMFAWHQYFASGSTPLRVLAHSTRPAMENLGLMVIQQGELSNDV